MRNPSRAYAFFVHFLNQDSSLMLTFSLVHDDVCLFLHWASLLSRAVRHSTIPLQCFALDANWLFQSLDTASIAYLHVISLEFHIRKESSLWEGFSIATDGFYTLDDIYSKTIYIKLYIENQHRVLQYIDRIYQALHENESVFISWQSFIRCIQITKWSLCLLNDSHYLLLWN